MYRSEETIVRCPELGHPLPRGIQIHFDCNNGIQIWILEQNMYGIDNSLCFVPIKSRCCKRPH